METYTLTGQGISPLSTMQIQTSKGRSIQTPHCANPRFPSSAPASAGGLTTHRMHSNGFRHVREEECECSALGECSLDKEGTREETANVYG